MTYDQWKTRDEPTELEQFLMQENIVTSHWAKPIPMRQFDWQAVYSNYDVGDRIGYGATEIEAVQDLIGE